MADPQGFLQAPRARAAAAPSRAGAASGLAARSTSRRPTGSCSGRPAAAWTAASRSATTGCPLGNLIPEWNDLVWRDDWARRDRAAARDQQLPGVHRPAVPGAVRDRVRARHQPADPVTIKKVEVDDHRPGLGRRAGSTPQPPERLHRQDGRRRRLRPGRARRRPAADPRRAHRRRLRARRPHRRPAALRHPRVQDGEAPSSTGGSTRCGPRAPVPHRRRRRRRRHRRSSCATATTRSCSPSARPCRATCRCPGRELGGIHQAMEYLPPANRVRAGRAGRRARSPPTGKHVVIIGGGDTGADCLGTAHRQGAASVHPARDHAAAAATSAPADQPVADVPDDLPRRPRAHEEGGERRLRRQHRGVPRRRRRPRRGRCALVEVELVDGRFEPRSRAPSARSRPSWCCSRWASSGRSGDGPASSSSASSSTSAATSPATALHDHRCRASSSPATPAAASR